MPCTTPCKNCDRKGLPILFTRYAAAYSAQSSGMDALKKVKPMGQLQAQPGGVAMQTALYNVRMLRPGCLYVRIEYEGLTPEWSGYAVHPHGYLMEFPVACPQDAKPSPACEVEIRGANASMVWVRDAEKVKSLHYLFHPDPLDYEHLRQEIEPNRDKYMQKFDVAGWAKGSTSQKDTLQPGQLNGQVVEFAAIGDKAVQTVGNEQHFGLMGTHGAERGWGDYAEARHGRHFESVRNESRDVDGTVTVTDTGGVGGYADGPYLAEVKSPRYEDVHGKRLKKIAEYLQQRKGAVVACHDGLGIAQELALHKLTAASPYVAWLKDTDVTPGQSDARNPKVTNQWREAAAASLHTMTEAIHKRAMAVYDEKTDELRAQRERMNWPDPRYLPPTIMVPQPDGSVREVPREQVRQHRKDDLDKEISQREANRMQVSEKEAEAALKKTQAHYNTTALKTFTDVHETQRKDRDQRMDAIAEDLIAWFDSVLLNTVTLSLYSRTERALETGDGVRCAAQLCAALTPMDSSPRGREWFGKAKLFGEDPKNLVWRMVSFNNDVVVQELQRAMAGLSGTLPPATGEEQATSAEESARQQRAFADMVAALGKIPKTLKQGQSLIDKGKEALSKNTPIPKRIEALQKIVETAKGNIHSVWAAAVTAAARYAPAGSLEMRFAKAQMIGMASTWGQRATQALESEQRAWLKEQEEAGRKVYYSNKRNPEPDSRTWKRKYTRKQQKLESRVERMAEGQKDKAARDIRIPGFVGMVETWSLYVSLRRAAERGDDPKAGVDAAASIVSGVGAMQLGRAAFYESNLYSPWTARLAQVKDAVKKLGPGKGRQAATASTGALAKASDVDLQALNAGAAHWVAAGTIILAVKDVFDGGQAARDGDQGLAWAYGARVGGTVTGVIGALGAVKKSERVIKILRYSFQISKLFKGLSIAGTAITTAATYVIGKIKEDDWIRWLEAQPFRKSDSTRFVYSSEEAMVDALGNVIADMDLSE